MNNKDDTVLPHGCISCDYTKEYVPRERTNRILSHPYAELIVIRQGDVIYTARGQTRRLGDKCIIYNCAGFTHNQFVQEEHLYERYKLCFYKEDLCDLLQNSTPLASLLNTPMLKEVSDEGFDLIFTLSREIFALQSSDAQNELARMRCQHMLILALLHAAHTPDKPKEHEASYITEVVKYISSHLTENPHIEDIAAAFFVSKSKLTNDFKAYCNMSIHEHIAVERVERAKELLKAGYRVAAVAETLGFSSASYFIKAFTALAGITPFKWQLRSMIKA
ncbi:MAG: helix-turn-helix transcriptional regulator [Clostridia bacterium]|nr:helix-turn-helix transcriptional regulator [Clostridia bacterium]